MAHANAPVTESGRLKLAQLVVDHGWPVERVTDRFRCADRTVRPCPTGITPGSR